MGHFQRIPDEHLAQDPFNRYRRNWGKLHPDKILISRLNSAVNLLRKHGVIVTVPETGYTNICMEGGEERGI